MDGLASLWVGFAGVYSSTLASGQQLTFGRAADLVVDDNPMLHRRLGLLQNDGAYCTLANIGNRITLFVDGEGGYRAEVPSGRRLLLPEGPGHIRFMVGRSRFDIEFLARFPGAESALVSREEGHASTLAPKQIDLTPNRRILLTALVESDLTGDGSARPSTGHLIRRTGMSHRSVERALDEICELLDPDRQLGLAGSPDRPARNRRDLLARYVLETGMITTDDLDLLNQRDSS